MQIPLLPRYLLRLFTPLFGLSLLILAAVLFMHHSVRLLNVALLNGASPGWVAASIWNLLPGVIALAVPMAFLLGLLLTLGGLSEEGEIVALRASGYSFFQMLWPLGIFALALTLLLIYLNSWAAPAGLRDFKNERWRIMQTVSNLNILPKTVIQAGNWKIYAEDTDNEKGILLQAKLFRYPAERSSGEQAWLQRINAPEGAFRFIRGAGLELILKNGEFMQADGVNPQKVIQAEFKFFKMFIPLSGPDKADREPSMQEMSSAELMSKLGSPDTDGQHRREYTVEISTRFALSFIPLIFLGVGASLGLMLEKRSRVWGTLFSLLIAFMYYGLLVSSVNIGRRHEFFSAWITWMPNLLGIFTCLYLWRRNLAR